MTLVPAIPTVAVPKAAIAVIVSVRHGIGPVQTGANLDLSDYFDLLKSS